MIRFTRWVFAVTVVALVTSPLQAANRFWQNSNTGSLGDANYANGANVNLSAGTGDVVHIGGGGTANLTSGAKTYQKLRVGHTGATNPGDGNVTISGGATVSLTAGAALAANAAIWVGSGKNGTLTIDGPLSAVTSNRLIEIGYGNDLALSGTINVKNGGALTSTLGNINLGDRTADGESGIPGHLTLDGSGSTISLPDGGADLPIGLWAPSSYAQTNGTLSIADDITVGQHNAHASTFTMSGGSLTTTGTTGQIIVGGGDTTDGFADNCSASISGNSLVNLTGSIEVGLGDSTGNSLTVGGTAEIHLNGTAGNGNVFVGRGTSTSTAFTMTGGTIYIGNHFLMGNSSGATGIVGTQSAGIINTANNFVLSDTGGSSSTYTLSGTGQINASGLVIVGRQSSTSTMTTMNQTGGSVTATKGVAVGRAENATTSLWGSGTYNVSGGTITASQVTGTTTALWIGSQGTGIFRVIGDGATSIDINGDMLVNEGGGAHGTLAYQLESGESLSVIDVSGTATFANGAKLEFDPSAVATPSSSYDLLVAGTIVDSGISFNVSGWGYRIVYAATPSVLGDHNNDKVVNLADYVTWRANDGENDQGYLDYRANLDAHGRQILQVYQLTSGASLQGAGVPEPVSIVLLLCGAFGLMLVRRR